MIPPLIADLARSHGLPALKRAVGLVTRLVPIPQPMMVTGAGASARLGRSITDFHHRQVMVVTDRDVARLGLLRPLLAALEAGGTAYTVFDAVTPDAPIALIEQGIEHYRREGCDALVAVGGGSVMDAAKVIGLAVANHKSPLQLVGYFKGLHAPPPIYAVPTTAGTGSEVTVAAVISEPEAGRKHVVADIRLVPRMAALDPELMVGLPPAITAATGMDALTHAVEAYIGQWGTEATGRWALAAVKMIYRHLPRAYDDGHDLESREQMAQASMYAGLAFTRANVGNVHALAHQLGGRYHTPHGLANAIMLPVVLRFSAPVIQPQLAELARRAGLKPPGRPGKTGKAGHAGAAGEAGHAGAAGEAALAQAFLDSVEAMNRRLGIPATLAALREEDIPELARAACHEADANYPVPRVMSPADAEALLRAVLPPTPPSQPAKDAARPAAPRRRGAVKTRAKPAR